MNDKKKGRKLALHRESVRLLGGVDLVRVAAAKIRSVWPTFCAQDDCSMSCQCSGDSVYRCCA